MRASIAALILTTALAVAGCGGSSSSSGTSSSGATSTPSPGSSGKTVQVTLQNIAFNPSTTTAKVGQTITWTNRDTVSHNVTAKTGGSFHSPTLGQGQTYSYKLTKPGTITYVCTIHPGMQATINVTG